ncbi:MAG TPA: penicillin acylase family protein [Methylomirabilota bacterium]|nr:penicillin acylase family protein [Methylomirabilota bacterium]
MTAGERGERLRAAVPDTAGRIRVPGLGAAVEVWRDPEGVAHVRAASAADAFIAQGFVHAQDRLWQMHYDRRRAAGRSAECIGPAGVPDDLLMRRLRLAAGARADHAALNAEARAMLEAYAAGVNGLLAHLEAQGRWPIEFQLLGAPPEPWEPWHSLAVFKVRHALMGTWQLKAWRARLVRQLGREGAARLCPGTPTNPLLIVPPGVRYDGPLADMLADVTPEQAALSALGSWDGGGSNSWALAGARTAAGQPLVAGDPHRALDVPNVYYQNHVACPEFDAIGLSIPGVPGLSHFGHNREVAWCVTHAQADVQDLYVERFDPRDPRRYQFRGEWLAAEGTREVIEVAGGERVPVDVTTTRHGPIVLGDHRQGQAVALRYTATATPDRTAEAFLPALRAASADELEAAMRPWRDPVQNLVFADRHGPAGRIGYRTRGQVPIRPRANAWLPVPGWDGAHEWASPIPFEAMPTVRDPVDGLVVTANSRVTGPEYPYELGVDFGGDARTRRLWERLRPLRRATAADMAAIHGDRVSLPARELIALLARDAEAVRRIAGPAAGPVLDTLLGWDADLDPESVAATYYATLRERLVRDLMSPLLGPLTAEAFAGAPRGGVAHMARLRGIVTDWIRRDDRTALPPGTDWPTALGRALAGTVAELGRRADGDRQDRRWGDVHRTGPRHPLSARFPEWAEALDPPAVPMGGDADTVQQAGYYGSAGFTVAVASVARYVFDLADWERSGWVLPLGVSGHPGSRHFADQLPAWRAVRLHPMRYDWGRIRREAASHQVLDPA